jgi:hypothetical protein
MAMVLVTIVKSFILQAFVIYLSFLHVQRHRGSLQTYLGLFYTMAQCHKTFYICHLQILITSQSVCPRQAYPA